MKQFQCIICDQVVTSNFKPIQCPDCHSEMMSEVMEMDANIRCKHNDGDVTTAGNNGLIWNRNR